MIAQIIVAHLVGDYLLQSDWMALRKVRRWWPAFVHGFFYTLPFLFITLEWEALAIIAGTHVVIDRFRLARHVGWLKNWLAPVVIRKNPPDSGALYRLEAFNQPWKDCKATGYPSGRPAWLTTWLMIITDNTMHLLCNIAAIYYFG